jgi:hypothetical protein
MLDLEKARKELGEKNLDDIQSETAWTWASRAAVSFENCLTSVGIKKITCFAVGLEYYHESLEHSSLYEGGDLLSEIKKQLEPYQERAAKDIDEMLAKEKGPAEKTPNE